jgi:hypothetical protein
MAMPTPEPRDPHNQSAQFTCPSADLMVNAIFALFFPFVSDLLGLSQPFRCFGTLVYALLNKGISFVLGSDF